MTSTNIPKIRIHNSETGEVIDREMTADEYKQYQTDTAKFGSDKLAKAKAEAERNAILEKLGITADEAKLLLS
jgi:hypothetical protein